MSSSNNLLIYTAADANYSLQAEVLLLSLIKTQNTPVHLIIFGNQWTPREIDRVRSLATTNVTAEVREVNLDILSTIKLASKFPLATTYNLIAPQYLLEHTGRALYLDADVVVLESLHALFRLPMTSAVGAVVDAHIALLSSPTMWRPWREENINPLTPYLNTGVMLIDLDRWRTERLTNRIMVLLSKYELPCVDQDAINLVLKGSFDRLEPRFNSMPYHHLTQFRHVDSIDSYYELGQAITNPAIIHFHRSFLGKPWTFGSAHPGTRLWRDLAGEVNPRWKRSIDIRNILQRRGAQFAKMARMDHRTIEFPSLM